MATKLPYLNVLEVESVNKEDVSRAIVIDKDEYVKALDIEQITTYQGLSNKPKVNGVELDGDISLDELNVASKEDLNKVISDLEDITSDIPTSENIQDKIDDSLKNYPTKSDVTTEINNSIADKANKSEIPTKVSQLENDEGYLTTIPSEYVTESELNDKGYLTSESLTTINSDIDELETSKQEAFQVNQPLVFSRSGEDLILDVNLDNYVTDTELDSKQDKLTPGDNINITDNVISWEAPDIQFVNTIFTDDTSLKYTVSDFNGTSTEKTFPVATQTSAGLMSVADKTKLDNLDESGGSVPYLKVGLTSIVSGDFTAVYNAIENDEAYFLQVPWSGGEIYGYFINPETVWASNNTIYCISQEHKSDGSFDQFNWTITANSVTYTIDRGNAIPYLKVNNSTIVSGEFESVRNAIKQNHPYNIFLYVTGTLDYFGPPELVRLANDNQIECYTSYHPRDGEYIQTTWLINSDGSVTKTDRSYELVETYSGTSSLPQINVIRVLTQEEYDNLAEYDDYTQYIII